MKALIPLLLLGTLFVPAAAATLRPYTQLHAGAVRLSDLFGDLGAVPDRVLGPAPAPGDRIVVEAPQLAAIARDFGVDWRPQSGTERAVLERAGTRLPRPALLTAIRAALQDAGAPSDADILLPGVDPPLVADAATARAEVTNMNFDAQSGRFSAMLAVQQPDMPPLRVPLSGVAVVMQSAAVLTRPVPLGAIIAAADLEIRHVPVRQLGGHVPLSVDQITGLALRRARSPGVPLMPGDVAAPVSIARGGIVRLSLDAGAIALTAQAIALDAGGVNDRIRVQNPSSRAIVEAIVTGSGTARVLPGAAAISLAAAQ